MHVECAFIRIRIGVDERLMRGCETTSGGGFNVHLPSIYGFTSYTLYKFANLRTYGYASYTSLVCDTTLYYTFILQ